MNLPIFEVNEDPGPNFFKLLGSLDHGEPSFLKASQSLGHGLEAVQANEIPHGTTIVAVRFDGGVLIAGDRRATAGNIIADRRIEKVYPADRFSAVGFAGSAGPAMEMVKLFQVQLEHYEKVEGVTLSLEGKANQLAQMIRANLPMAMQGLVVVPLFVGWDKESLKGRIFNYDVTGGRYEEVDYYAIGSGGREAQAYVKFAYRSQLSKQDVIRLALRSLFEAAQEDSATGGPDFMRGVYPIVATVDENGYERASEVQIAEISKEVVDEVAQGGPRQ